MKQVTVMLELSDAQAWNLAQFLKRVGWHEFRANAVDEDEAYAIREAVEEVQKALSNAGYKPR